MHTKTIITGVLMFFTFFSFAQNRTYLGIEIGPKFEIYNHIDNGEDLYTQPFYFSPIYGVTLGQEINKTFILETGFFINNYGESYRIRGEKFWFASSAINAYQIPLRLKARLNLIKERLSIIPTIGYTFAINGDYGEEAFGGSVTTPNVPGAFQSTRSLYKSRYDLKKTYGMLESGIALEYAFKNSLRLFLSANYMKGFSRVVEVDVQYWIDFEPEQTGTIFSNGDYYSVVMGVRYPISNLWLKKSKI